MRKLFLIMLLFLLFPIIKVSAITIIDGDLIRVQNEIDVYIVKIIPSNSSGQVAEQYKRLILNPEIFNQYGHLKWGNIKTISQAEMNEYTISDLVRAVGDEKVYKLYSSGDVGEKRWIKTAEDFSGFNYKVSAIYEINNFERDFYNLGSDLIYQAPITPPIVPSVPARNPITIKVPSDYKTIQGAINASIDGDTISVELGIYNENIVINKKINLISNYTAGVVINGDGVDNAITINNDKDVLIQRLTIKSKDKDAIYCSGGRVSLKNNTIIDSGWGIVAENNCQMTLLNNLIYNNKKSDNKDGAGILIKNNSTYNITTEIRNNVINNNYHGIWSENANTKVLNNIITKNVGGVGSIESVGIYHLGTGISNNYYNDVWSNGLNFKGDALAGNGSIDVNPKFINEAQKDYRLQTWTTDYSPCINTGYPDFIYNDGTLITDSDYRNDMGAYGGPDNLGWTP